MRLNPALLIAVSAILITTTAFADYASEKAEHEAAQKEAILNRNNLTVEKSKTAAEIEGRDAAVRAVKSDWDAAVAAATGANSAFENAKSSLADAQSRLGDLRQRQSTLEPQVGELDGTVRSLQSESAVFENIYSIAYMESWELMYECDVTYSLAYSEALASLEAEMQGAMSAIESLAGQIANAESEKSDKEAELDGVRGEIPSVQNEVDVYSIQVSNTGSNAAAAQQVANAAESKYYNTVARFDALDTHFTQIGGMIDDYGREIDGIDAWFLANPDEATWLSHQNQPPQ